MLLLSLLRFTTLVSNSGSDKSFATIGQRKSRAEAYVFGVLLVLRALLDVLDDVRFIGVKCKENIFSHDYEPYGYCGQR